MSSLKEKALSGMYWTFIQQFGTQGIGFIVSIILARILLPSEFGLIALLSVFIGIGNALVSGGMNQSLIRANNISDEDFSTVFYFNLIISCLLYFLMYLSAPFIAKFYNQPLLIEISRLYCLTFIINALSITQNTRLTKDLDFKKQTIINIPSLIVSSTIGIIMAIYGYGVWSLVWSAIVKSTLLTIQLWWWSPWVPSLNFSKEKIKEHLNFGYKLTISAIINTLFKDIYTIIIGKFFDPIQVGFYNRANTLKQLPVYNFSAVLSKVTFPLFSKVQNDDVKLKSVYKKIMQMAVFLIAPILMIMAALAEPLFRFLFTEKWLPAVPYFQILCFNGILYPIHAYNLDILTVKGRSDLFMKLEILKKIIVLIGIGISFNWGIYGLLYGSVFLSITMLLVNTYFTGKFLNYSLIDQLIDIVPTIIIALLIGIFVYGFDSYFALFKLNDLVRIITGSILGTTLYIGISKVLKLNSFSELKSIISMRFGLLKRT